MERAQGGVGRRKKKRRGGKRKRQSKAARIATAGLKPAKRRGPRTSCICPACGTKITVQAEMPCYLFSCPRCGTAMTKDSKGKNTDLGDSQPE
jgi:PHP family Zn ribbon phosphoesterase